MNITIDDIANQLNISVSTVSRALNDNPRISEETKQRVLEVAKKLDYRPVVSEYGKKVISGEKMIALVFPNFNSAVYRLAFEKLQKELLSKGVLVSVYFSDNDSATERQIIDKLINLKPALVVHSFASDTVDYSHIQKLIDVHIPVFLYNRVNFDFQLPKIIVDNYQGSFNATARFIASGITRIGLIIGQRRCPISNEIINGVKQALLKNGLAWNANYLVCSDLEASSVSQAITYLLSLENPPEAIIADKPQTVLFVMQELASKGIKVPDDIPVIGFGAFEYNQFIKPSISTVEVDAAKMADELTKKVEEQLAFGYTQMQSNTIILPTELIIRGTSFK